MKTPEELVEELELAAKGSFGMCLFVAFEDSSIVLRLYRETDKLAVGRVVYEKDPGFLALLREAIANGGVPIGWSRLKTKKAAGDVVELGALQDHQRESWAYEYLTSFFGLEDKRSNTKYYLVYPDGSVLDITNIK